MQASENDLRDAVARVLEPVTKVIATTDKQLNESEKTQTRKVIYHMNDSGSMDATNARNYPDADSDKRFVSQYVEPPLLANRIDSASDSSNTPNIRRDTKSDFDVKLLKVRLKRQLLHMDISPVIAHAVSEMLVTNESDPKTLMPQALALISNQIPIYKEDVTIFGGTVALLGATGVGKTTTIAKMAARFSLHHGKDKVAVICTDNKRMMAAEQLRAFSNMLGIQYRIACDDIELLDALNEFSDKTFVLIDTAGMTPKEICESKFYDLFSGGITQIKNFLVVSSTMQRAALEQSTQQFSRLKIDGSIITKIDEATSLGAPLSTAILYDLPVVYFSDGQQIPEDLHLGRAHILMRRAVSVMSQFDYLQSDSAENNVGKDANVNF